MPKSAITYDATYSNALGVSDLQVRFHYYNANADKYWALDNVKVSCDYNQIPLNDGGGQWQAVELWPFDYVDDGSAPTYDIWLRFIFESDNLGGYTSGWVIDDISIGEPSGDGSIPCTMGSDSRGNVPSLCTSYHDKWDYATFEWDLDGDSVADNPNMKTPEWNILESDLQNYSLERPGDHILTLRVTDSLGLTDENHVTLHVLDGVFPTASVTTPNGGESWAYSESAGSWLYHLIVWESADNNKLAETKISYSTDGTTWTEINTYDYLQTFNSTDTPFAIPDNDPLGASSVLTVPTYDFVLQDMDVTVNLTHSRDSDLGLTQE